MIKNIYTKQKRQIQGGGGGEKIPVALLQCSENCKRFNKTFDLEYLCKNHQIESSFQNIWSKNIA